MELEARYVGDEAESLLRTSGDLRVAILTERAMYLRAGDDGLLILSIGGVSPHSITLDQSPPSLRRLAAPGQEARYEAESLSIGDHSIHIDAAQRVQRSEPLGVLPRREMTEWCLGILSLLSKQRSIIDPPPHMADRYGAFLARAAEARRDRSIEVLLSSAAELLGLGEGLTPSGDDVVAGILFGLYVAGIEADASWIIELAAERSSWPSYVLVEHASRGCSFIEHRRLYEALAREDRDAALSWILSASSLGHSSGCDFSLGMLLSLSVV